MPDVAAPPQAEERPHRHPDGRADPYSWLREVGSPAVLAHLAAERRWYDSAVGHLDPLVDALRTEMVSRVPATERSVSWRLRDRYYYTRVPAGREHPQLLRDLRRPETDPSRDPQQWSSETDELLLDAGLLGDAYVDLGVTLVSPDGRLLAYSVDLVGDEVFTLRFRDLDTGRDLDEVVPRSYYYGGAWAAGGAAFYYTVHDAAYRPCEVRRHVLGTPVSSDVVVLTEPDERFDLALRLSRSGAVVGVRSASRDTSEVWVLDAHDPAALPRSVGGRRPGVNYDAEHAVLPDGGPVLLLVTDDGAPEFRLMAASVPVDGDQDHTAWWPVREAADDERLERVDAFARHVVLTLRKGGSRALRVLSVADLTAPGRELRSRFTCGTVELGPSTAFDAGAVVVGEQSYVEPPLWSDLDLATGTLSAVMRVPAPGHAPSAYVCSRLTFGSPDGTQVPVTVVRHASTPLDGTAPALLYGYGAYEAVFEPEWDPSLPSLLDRGVVFAHAHVRGGGEGGRRWWLDGRLDAKQNTFTDHLAVADGLASGLVDPARLATRGLSAGGLLQAAVLTQRPDRWRAVVAEVPFVDVVTTMLDASIPLTVNEWDEWGDPRRPEARAWMLAYSPYDTIPPAGDRPDLLVTGALHDARVMVWEPAKWVAALRASDPAWSPRCLFRVELEAGSHVGPSGRFAHLGYEAEVHAWVLDRLGAGGA